MGLSTRSKLVLVIVTLVSFGLLGYLIHHLHQQHGGGSNFCNCSSLCMENDFLSKYNPNKDKTAYLTPFIEKSEINEGRNKAYWEWDGVQSYSGYFTVNETSDSNLFFWFFPVSSSYNGSDTAPIILYLQGGPGLSSLMGLFLETGPFYMDEEAQFRKRTYSWTNAHSVFYIDSPVSTGFSYGNDTDNYPTDTDAVAKDLYEALAQFFVVFHDYQDKDFFIAGTSYCAKYIPILANLIHKRNEQRAAVRINLKGVVIGGGYFDGAIQDKYAEFNYQLGFIDKNQKLINQMQEDIIAKLINENKYEDARNETLILKLNMTSIVSGWENYLSGNGLHMTFAPDFWNFAELLNTECVKQALHVDVKKKYLPIGTISQRYSRTDYYRSTRPEMETLLNANYSALIFAGQFDMVVTHVGISDFLDTLIWNRSLDYENAKRNQWIVNDTIAGWVREIPGFTYVVIRNSGHMPCKDSSYWCFDMIYKFTRGYLLSHN